MAIEDGLPKPVGYAMLVRIPDVEEKTAGGIIKPKEMTDKEKHASIIAEVVSMGDLCYADQKKFPAGAWCQPGDWIVMASYGGVRIKTEKDDYRLIHDDTVKAVATDIDKIQRG